MNFTMAHLMAFYWDKFGIKKDEFLSMWLPYIKFMFNKHVEVFNPSKSKTKTYDTDSMDINSVKKIFGLSGMPVKE